MWNDYKPYYQWLHYISHFITQDEDYVKNCPENTYIFSLNNSCLESCSHNYEIYKNECIFTSFDENTTISEFKNQVRNNITLYVNSSEVIIRRNFKAIVMTDDKMDLKETIKKGLSGVDLGNCINDLKDYYNISIEENYNIKYGIRK